MIFEQRRLQIEKKRGGKDLCGGRVEKTNESLSMNQAFRTLAGPQDGDRRVILKKSAIVGRIFWEKRKGYSS